MSQWKWYIICVKRWKTEENDTKKGDRRNARYENQTEIKNFFNEFISRWTQQRKDKTNEFEDRFNEIMQTEIQTEKKSREKIEHPITVVQSNIYVIRIPKGKERKNGAGKKCEDIMAENIPKAAKERYQPQIQETQLTLGKINTKNPHILGT